VAGTPFRCGHPHRYRLRFACCAFPRSDAVALSISRHGGSQGRRRVRCAGRGFSTNEEVVVAVSGNGSGGASIDHGSELRGLADRIEALVVSLT
jgi:hypothetical protein